MAQVLKRFQKKLEKRIYIVNNVPKNRVLILTERFYPEEFLINDLAAELKKNNHIEILTQVPSYPHDKVFQGYCNKLFQTTCEYQDIPVHRVKTYCGYNKSVFIKIFNYLNFAFLTSLWAFFYGFRYDKIFIYHTGPLTMASASLIFHYFWRKKCMIWTQDLWPDSVYAYGFKPTWWKRFLLENFVKMIYSSCSVITVSSPGFIEKLKAYVRKKDIVFVPQWSPVNEGASPEIKKEKKEKRVFTFAGNIGSVQNLDMVIEVFGTLKLKNCCLQLVGGGVFLEPLRKYAAENEFHNIYFTGRLPQKDMPEIFAASDILILSLKPEFSMTLPAKFQAYIAAGKAVLGIIEGDTAHLIKKYEAGYAAVPDKESIKKAFLYLADVSDEEICKWGNNALRLSETMFNREKIIHEFQNMLDE